MPRLKLEVILFSSLAIVFCIILAGKFEAFAGNEARSIRVIPHSVLMERLNGEDPLPRSRPPGRLEEDRISDAAAFFRNNQKSEAHQRSRDNYRLQTLVIEWERFPGARQAHTSEPQKSCFCARGTLKSPNRGFLTLCIRGRL